MKKLEIHPKPHYKSIRLKGYDYSQPGSYFVTICTKNRESLFGEIIDGEMVLNEIGKIVEKFLLEVPVHYPDVELDKYVVMPNHVHLIIVIYSSDDKNIPVEAIHELLLRVRMKIRRKMVLPKIIGRFKMNTSKQINMHFKSPIQSIWQRNYYEHVIRNERELNKIRRYIFNNPPKWEYDQENRNGVPIDEKKKFWTKFLNEFDDNSS